MGPICSCRRPSVQPKPLGSCPSLPLQGGCWPCPFAAAVLAEAQQSPALDLSAAPSSPGLWDSSRGGAPGGLRLVLPRERHLPPPWRFHRGSLAQGVLSPSRRN